MTFSLLTLTQSASGELAGIGITISTEDNYPVVADVEVCAASCCIANYYRHVFVVHERLAQGSALLHLRAGNWLVSNLSSRVCIAKSKYGKKALTS
jgi:hypothetical protein